jgi:hypothetical protein
MPPVSSQTISRLRSHELFQSPSNWIKWHNPEPQAVHNLTKTALFAYAAPRNMEIWKRFAQRANDQSYD